MRQKSSNVSISGPTQEQRTRTQQRGLMVLMGELISQTRGRVFPLISKHRKVGWKNEAQPRSFNQLRGVWKYM